MNGIAMFSTFSNFFPHIFDNDGLFWTRFNTYRVESIDLLWLAMTHVTNTNRLKSYISMAKIIFKFITCIQKHKWTQKRIRTKPISNKHLSLLTHKLHKSKNYSRKIQFMKCILNVSYLCLKMFKCLRGLHMVSTQIEFIWICCSYLKSNYWEKKMSPIRWVSRIGVANQIENLNKPRKKNGMKSMLK